MKNFIFFLMIVFLCCSLVASAVPPHKPPIDIPVDNPVESSSWGVWSPFWVIFYDEPSIVNGNWSDWGPYWCIDHRHPSGNIIFGSCSVNVVWIIGYDDEVVLNENSRSVKVCW